MKNKIVQIEAKSQLARLMANENLVVEHRQVSTASFDTKARVLTLPMWNEMTGNIYDTLVGHEVGHALETPNLVDMFQRLMSIDTNNTSGVKHFWNVIEDARIEKLIRRRYPGMRRSFSLGYKELVDRDFFGTKKRDIQDMNLIDRINMHFKLGALAIIEFLPQEKHFVDMIEKCETFEETYEITRAIYEYCKQNNTMNISTMLVDSHDEMEYADDYDNFFESFDESENYSEEGDGEGESTEGTGEGEGESEDSSDGESETDGESGDGSAEQDSDDNDASESDEDSSKGKNNKSDSTVGGDQTPHPNNLTSETDQNWEKNKNLLNEKKFSKGYFYADIPYLNSDHFVIPYTQLLTDFEEMFSRIKTINGKLLPLGQFSLANRLLAGNKLRRENTPVIAYMVKEFEMRKAAQAHARASISKTGVINTNKLYSYKYNEDIFRRITNVPNGKNHGLVMFLDWSGSMSSNIQGTLDQLVNLVLFCKRVQIPFEVYAFSDFYFTNNQGGNPNYKNIQFKTGEVLVEQKLALLQFLSSQMNVKQLNEMIANLSVLKDNINKISGMDIRQLGLGGTPLNQTIIVASDIVNKFRKKFKAEVVNTIFLTDGGDSQHFTTHGNNSSAYSAMYNKTIVLRDNKLKNEYRLVDGYQHSTKCLLANLRARTDCNIIGFHLIGAHRGYFMSALKMIDGTLDFETYRNKFLKENFLSFNDTIYGTQYLIKDGEDLRIDNKGYQITTKDSARSIAKQFSKYYKNKLENRIFLNQFIEKIA